MPEASGSVVLTGQVIEAAIRVHMELGPGLLESVYEVCLTYELRSRGLEVRSQVPQDVVYRGAAIPGSYRLDLLVQNELVVELKTVAKLLPIHEAQLLSYLRLSQRSTGLLINFHVPRLKDGIRRIRNG